MLTEFDLTDGPVPLRVTAGPASGPPLVLFHGVGRRGVDFLPLVPALAARWHVHLVDHRGHGGSGRAAGRYLVTDHADDALAVLAWLGRPAVLFGHSLGALVAAAAAARRPELVRAVVLEDPPSAAFLARLPETAYYPTFVAMRRLAGPGKDVAAVARELGETFVPTPDGTRTVRLADVRDACSLRFIARCLADADGDVFTPALEGRWLSGYDEAAVWRALPCPVLLLRGDPALGGMLPAADAEVMSSVVADLTRVDVPGAGHLIHGMATEVTLRHVLNFLESLP